MLKTYLNGWFIEWWIQFFFCLITKKTKNQGHKFQSWELRLVNLSHPNSQNAIDGLLLNAFGDNGLKTNWGNNV